MNNTTPIETSIRIADADITIWGAMRYCHLVTIIVDDACSETFDYHGSEADYIAHKDVLSEPDLIDALECITRDAISGTYDCAEFFSNFGCEDPCEGLKAWRGCVRTCDRLVNMGIAEDMFYDVLNELDGGD